MGRTEHMLRSFSSRKTRLEFLRKLEQSSGEEKGFFSDMATLMRKSFFWGVTAMKSAFIDQQDYQDFIYPLIPDINIEQTKIPFGCVAADIRNGKRVMFIQGSLRTAISASCSLPGIFPPVEDNGMLLVDGGWVERVPVHCARTMGADIVIAVDVSSSVEPFDGDRSGLDIILRADAVTRIYLNELQVNGADLVIHPLVSQIHWADFSDAKFMFKQGESAALEKLEAIRSIVLRTIVPRKKFADHLKKLKGRIMASLKGTPN